VAKVQNGAVLRPLRVLMKVGPLAGLSDAQLLERFMGADGEEAEFAFAAIIDRHGPMVRRICRQMLGNRHDGQDAFQAAFFILARKARTVRTRESLASWLHGVAHRVCLRARSANCRRRVHERMAATHPGAGASGFNEGETAECGELLHAELARLPERFRAPILLCDLQGVAYEEAARLLGCPVGTVKSRLARGRERLRVRLGRRGLAPSAGILVAPLLRASVPATLRDTTAHAAIRFTMHGTLAVGKVSTTAISLTETVLKSMILFRLKLAAVVLALTGFGTTAMAVLAGLEPGGYSLSTPRQATRDDASPVVREMPLLTKVEFRGRKAIRLKEIEDTTGLKVGNRADPEGARLAVGQILRLYEVKGYDLASVTLLEGGNPGNTRIVIEIFEGPKVKVNRIIFVGNHFASAAQLRTKIAAHKPIRVPLGQHRGEMLDEFRHKLIDYYDSEGFFEAKVSPVTRPGTDPDQVDVTFVISEGTRYKVRNVIIEGNTKIKTEKLREGLELHSGKPFVRATREADKNRMLIKYSEIGCIHAQIVCEPRFSNESGVVDLVYKIQEGEPLMLDELRVPGSRRTQEKLILREAVSAALLPPAVLDKDRIEIFRRRLM
jgi:RNA polymerase sigma factor (sigma-70 family)